MTVQCTEAYTEGLIMFKIITYVCQVHKVVCTYIQIHTHTNTET